MKVEFLLNVIADMTRAERNVALLVEQVAVNIGLDPVWIDRVVVAEYERFGEAVGYFDKSRIYTNANGLLAAGKTFPKSNQVRPSSSSIIFGLPIIGGIYNASAAAGPDSKSWTPEQQHALYVVYHELGHCLDHTRRPQLSDDGTRRTPEGSRVVDYTVDSICKYHFGILYPELPACVFGACGYTEQCREQDRLMNNQFIRQQLPALREATLQPSRDLGEIFNQVGSFFWFILIQHIKYAGSAIGNVTLPRMTPESLWELASIDEEIADALRKAEAAIESAWKKYPEVDPDFRDALVSCFHTMSRACGYTLEIRDGHDGVWWDYLIQDGTLIALEGETTGGQSTQ